MSFFSKLFSNVKFRPSKNYNNNIFFLKNSLSFWYNHTLYLHAFLPTKNLTIKFFKNNKLSLKVVVIIFVFFLILISTLILL